MTQEAPSKITAHYKVTMRSDETICVLTCRYCSQQFSPIDRSGRRNWLGAMTHTMKHVNERLAASGAVSVGAENDKTDAIKTLLYKLEMSRPLSIGSIDTHRDARYGQDEIKHLRALLAREGDKTDA